MKEKWEEIYGIEGRAIDIVNRFKVSSVTASFLASKFEEDDNDIESFLAAEETGWPDPARLPNIDPATERIASAVRKKEKILVHGDYDVDGLMGATIWLGALRAMGSYPEVHIPSRFQDGYGFSEGSLKAIEKSGVSLVITTDCGTNCGEKGDRLPEMHADLVVTDHHLPVRGRQPRCPIVNAHLEEEHPDKDLCGAAVAMQCALKTASKLGIDLPAEPFMRLAAIATISDVADMTNKNRKLCRNGFATLRNGPSNALSAMFRKSSPNESGSVRSRDVAYYVAPRFNAAGRLGDATIVLDLLMERDPAKVAILLGKLEGLNTERRKLQNAILEEAEIQALSLKEKRAVVVGSKGWNEGIMGPVASRLAESLGAPAFVAAFRDGIGKGSARSFGGVDVTALLSEAADLLERFGGHKSAAGFTIKRENLAELRRRINQSNLLEGLDDLVDSRKYFMLEKRNLLEAWEAMGIMDPFGPGNEEPYIGVKDLYPVSCRVVKDNHLIWKVENGAGKFMNVIAWSGIPRGFNNKSIGGSDVAIGKLCPESWNGHFPFYFSVEAIL